VVAEPLEKSAPTNNQQLSEREKMAFVLKAAQDKLINFCEVINPKWETVFFHELIAQKLQEAVEKVKQKKKARIILTVPPRMGKSQISSIYFPAWALGKYPDLKFIFATYGAELAERMGLQTRDVISSEMYQMIFPHIELRQDQKAKAKWMTNKKGSYTAVGAGGPITGMGGDIIICDDLLKSRDEAESETMRKFVWDYYRSTLYSRLEGYGAIIVIMQRWHTEDLVGKLLEEEDRRRAAGEPIEEWEIINFPAIAEQDEYVEGKLVRKEGDPLWPSKFPLEILDNIKATAGVYNFVSQYQQQPVNSETQEFRTEWFKYFDDDYLVGKNLKYYTIIDPAISQKKEADNTVVLTVAKEVNGPNWYRVREDAGHFTPTQTINLIFQHQQQYRSWVYVETVAYQAALKFAIMEEQRARQVYFVLNEIKTNTNKEVRIRGLIPAYQAGVVWHKRSDTEYERELLTFPRGRRDDRADCMSMAIQVMQNTSSGNKQFRHKFSGYFNRS
jgi:predicted phage terminase large subunit-like protein